MKHIRWPFAGENKAAEFFHWNWIYKYFTNTFILILWCSEIVCLVSSHLVSNPPQLDPKVWWTTTSVWSQLDSCVTLVSTMCACVRLFSCCFGTQTALKCTDADRLTTGTKKRRGKGRMEKEERGARESRNETGDRGQRGEGGGGREKLETEMQEWKETEDYETGNENGNNEGWRWKKENDLKERKTKKWGKFNDKVGSWKGGKKGADEPK